jgi:bifunctional ADP-heptose synthase (sugar kinase/adenylyltransferase)
VAPPDAETASRLLRVLETTLPTYSALIISDYSKGIFLDDGLGRNLCVEAIKQARSLKIPVLVDPKRDEHIFRRCLHYAKHERICAGGTKGAQQFRQRG